MDKNIEYHLDGLLEAISNLEEKEVREVYIKRGINIIFIASGGGASNFKKEYATDSCLRCKNFRPDR